MKAEIDINIRCPDCSMVMQRDPMREQGNEYKYVISCHNPSCISFMTFYHAPTVELIPVEPE